MIYGSTGTAYVADKLRALPLSCCRFAHALAT
jgi:hypothetical protein